MRQRVLMLGPGRDVRGGISTVVNNYYRYGLDKAVELTYLPTMEDGSKAKKLLTAAKAYAAFDKALEDCDIVHVHMAAQASFDRKALFVEHAKKAGKKIIIHQHAADFDRYYFKQSDDKKRERIGKIFAMADKVIVLSEEWAEFFGKNVCDADKIIILHNGVPVPEYEKTDRSDRNVLMLGKLGERKGTYDLLKAVPEVLRAVPDAMFYLCGDGDVEECKKIASDTGIADHVFFSGWVSDAEKEEYLKKCSTFILPSYHEGMPMSVLEAMSYGLAAISTNVGGIPQIIDNNLNGVMVEAGDVKGVSEALISVLSDEAFRKRLGEAGRARIKEKFDLAGSVGRLAEIYYEF